MYRSCAHRLRSEVKQCSKQLIRASSRIRPSQSSWRLWRADEGKGLRTLTHHDSPPSPGLFPLQNPPAAIERRGNSRHEHYCLLQSSPLLLHAPGDICLCANHSIATCCCVKATKTLAARDVRPCAPCPQPAMGAAEGDKGSQPTRSPNGRSIQRRLSSSFRALRL